jgi:hypothetical protein
VYSCLPINRKEDGKTRWIKRDRICFAKLKIGSRDSSYYQHQLEYFQRHGGGGQMKENDKGGEFKNNILDTLK